MNIEKLDDYIVFNSYEQYGYVCIRSYTKDIFIRVGKEGCELEKMHAIGSLNVVGIDAI